MTQDRRIQRLELTVQCMRNDINALIQRGTDMEVELALRQAEIDRLTAALKAARKAKK